MGNYRTRGQLQSACKENKNLEPCKSRQPYKAALVTVSVMPDDGRRPPQQEPTAGRPVTPGRAAHALGDPGRSPRLTGHRAPCWPSSRNPKGQCAAVTAQQRRGPLGHSSHRWSVARCPTLNTLIWQLAECKCSVYSPFSFCLNVSICTRKGTPFSPPCFRGVNSVLIQCTCKGKCGPVTSRRVRPGPALLKGPLPNEVSNLPRQVHTCLSLPALPPTLPSG